MDALLTILLILALIWLFVPYVSAERGWGWYGSIPGILVVAGLIARLLGVL